VAKPVPLPFHWNSVKSYTTQKLRTYAHLVGNLNLLLPPHGNSGEKRWRWRVSCVFWKLFEGHILTRAIILGLGRIAFPVFHGEYKSRHDKENLRCDWGHIEYSAQEAERLCTQR
jgi:hypothetical protein